MAHGRWYLNLALFTIIITAIIGNRLVNAEEKIPRMIDFAFVLDFSPLEWDREPPETVYTPENETPETLFQMTATFRGWAQTLLKLLLEPKDRDCMATLIFLQPAENSAFQKYAFTENYMAITDYIKPSDHKVVRHAPRLHDAEKIVDMVKNAINRPQDRTGAPLLLLWHVPYKGPPEALKNLSNTKYGPDVVVAFESYFSSQRLWISVGHGKEPIYQVVADDWLQREEQMKAHVEKLWEMVDGCKTVIDYSPCYYNDSLKSARKCIEDSSYKPAPGTDQSKTQYCLSGIRAMAAPCHLHPQGREECDRICTEEVLEPIPCNAKCDGEGTEEWFIPPHKLNKYTKNCRRDPVPCHATPCPKTGEPGPPLPTTVQMSRPTTITLAAPPEPTVKGIVLEPWQIALIAIGGTTVLVVVIGVIVCCARREKRRRKFPRGQRPPWYSLRERLPPQGHTHQPRGFPSRGQDTNIRTQRPQSTARPSYFTLRENEKGKPSTIRP